MEHATMRLLAEIPLFSNMDDEERDEIYSLMTERIFHTGQVIMKGGEQGNAAFQIIQQGEVELWLIDSDGQKVVLDVIGEGKFFGELGMLAGETRNATAVSEEKVITLELSRTEFFDFLRRRPDAALDVLTELGDRLKHTDDILRTRVSRNPNDAIEEHVSGDNVSPMLSQPLVDHYRFSFLTFSSLSSGSSSISPAPAACILIPIPFNF